VLFFSGATRASIPEQKSNELAETARISGIVAVDGGSCVEHFG
jgi:hypothetical protein